MRKLKEFVMFYTGLELWAFAVLVVDSVALIAIALHTIISVENGN